MAKSGKPESTKGAIMEVQGRGVRSVRAAAPVLAALLTGCATYRTDPPPPFGDITFVKPSKTGAVPEEGQTQVEFAQQTFLDALWDSAGKVDDEVRARKAYETGLAALTSQCESYLGKLGAANQRASNERKQVGLTGGFFSAIMGLTGSAASSISGVATAFSFAGSSMDASATTFLFTDAAKSLTNLVHSAQQAYIAKAAESLPGLHYSGAVTLLAGFSAQCEPGKIRALVDEAVTNATIVAETPGQQSTDARLLILIGTLAGTLGQPVDESTALTYYAWYTGNALQRAKVKNGDPSLKARLTTAAAEAAFESLLTPFFAPLALKDDPIAKRWAAAAEQLKGPAVAAAAGAAVNTPKPAAAPLSMPITRVAR